VHCEVETLQGVYLIAVQVDLDGTIVFIVSVCSLETSGSLPGKYHKPSVSADAQVPS
jgi:hypothetical protein